MNTKRRRRIVLTNNTIVGLVNLKNALKTTYTLFSYKLLKIFENLFYVVFPIYSQNIRPLIVRLFFFFKEILTTAIKYKQKFLPFLCLRFHMNIRKNMTHDHKKEYDTRSVQARLSIIELVENRS